MEKNTRQLIIHCLDGDVFPASQDDQFEFKVNDEFMWKKVNKKRLKGKR